MSDEKYQSQCTLAVRYLSRLELRGSFVFSAISIIMFEVITPSHHSFFTIRDLST